MDYEKLKTQRYELANVPELWQFALLTPRSFCKFVRDRGVMVFDADTVMNLWRLGLLRADLVAATSKLEMPSLELVSEDDDRYTYCDGRKVEYRGERYGGTFPSAGAESDEFELLFHPFRLYVMYHVDRVFQAYISSTQYLLNPDGLISLAQHHINDLDRWTSGKEFAERFEHWNRTSELAIVVEPAAYTAVFQAMIWRPPDTQDGFQTKLLRYRGKVKEFLSEASVSQINEIRAELCREAELLDPNKLVHVLLRLMSRHQRLNLRGTLGGCMLFLCMAEIIRRGAEGALGQDLPEEDEMGFGKWIDGARESIYGSDRILDSPRKARREFLTSMGLDYGIKARCYVEGDTEFGALTSAVGDAGGTEFVNLRGQVVEKRGRGLNFVASLKMDMRSHVFSVVVLDQDRADYVRALKKAARDGTFFGRFFISSPDFEFANLTVSELVDVLLGLAGKDRDPVPTKDEVLQLVGGAVSSKQFFDILGQNGFSDIGKSEKWGIALMSYALEHPVLPRDHNRAGEERPVIEVAQLLVRARDVGYLRSLDEYRVDPDTGALRRK